MVSFSLRQRIFYLLLQDPTPVSFHLSQFVVREVSRKFLTAPSKSVLLRLGGQNEAGPSVAR
jgi:hypothetical protein